MTAPGGREAAGTESGVQAGSSAALLVAALVGPADPLVGRVLCDDIVPIYRDELKEDPGALSRETMIAVAAGLSAALGLT